MLRLETLKTSKVSLDNKHSIYTLQTSLPLDNNVLKLFRHLEGITKGRNMIEICWEFNLCYG